MKKKPVLIYTFLICLLLLIVTMVAILMYHDANSDSDHDFYVRNEPDISMPKDPGQSQYDSGIKPSETYGNHESEQSFETESEMEMEATDVEEFFYSLELDDEIKKRITGISYPDTTEPIQISYEELRYVSVLYYDFNDEVKQGELICNEVIADKLIEIFKELYENKYQIESIRLIDEFYGDDEQSMAANNSSCFNYRNIAGTNKISNHSYGLAIDINPRYNPYVTYRNGGTQIQPENGVEYADREAGFEHKITEEDLCYQLFIKHGFTWGGAWKNSKDYQHFEYKK